jgi:hypothetical protein
MAISKITRAQLSSISEPGRYEYPFGWLTVTDDDLVVLRRYPKAVFSLITLADGQEHRLGTFEMNEDLMDRVRAVQLFLPDGRALNGDESPQESIT